MLDLFNAAKNVDNEKDFEVTTCERPGSVADVGFCKMFAENLMKMKTFGPRGSYHRANKKVTDIIFKLGPICASVIYQIP